MVAVPIKEKERRREGDKLNISDIAVKAGVSVSTVSRVINNSPNVNVDTRSRILQIMEETGYVWTTRINVKSMS